MVSSTIFSCVLFSSFLLINEILLSDLKIVYFLSDSILIYTERKINIKTIFNYTLFKIFITNLSLTPSIIDTKNTQCFYHPYITLI